jgi:hypothetical protein
MLKHVLHGFDDEGALQVLQNCRAVLSPADGRLLVIEFVLPDIVNEPDSETELRLMSDLNMLVVTGGKERSARQWIKLLAQADLRCEAIIPVAGDAVSIIEATAQ